MREASRAERLSKARERRESIASGRRAFRARVCQCVKEWRQDALSTVASPPVRPASGSAAVCPSPDRCRADAFGRKQRWGGWLGDDRDR